MKRLFKPAVCGAVAIALASWIPQAQAVPLAPGATVGPSPEPDPVGGVVIASLVSPFVAGLAPNIFSGTIYTTVISGAVNPLGGLTFTYRFVSDATSATSIERLTVEGYAGYLVDVSHQAPVVGVPNTTTDRSGGAGDVIGFTWIGAPIGFGLVGPGLSSALLVVQTSADNYKVAQANLIDGAVATTSILAPAIPDGGTTAVLLGFALLGIVGWSRRFATTN